MEKIDLGKFRNLHRDIYAKQTQNLTAINVVKFEMNWRSIAILHNSLCHSITRQKFEIMHVQKKFRDETDLDYPQLIQKLCNYSKEFKDTIELYNFLMDEFNQSDIASICNKDFNWCRTKRKKYEKTN